MDSNFESLSPDNADRNPSFRKPSNDKVNRKYRRHSSMSGSDSSSSDGPKHGRTHSPSFSREDPAKISDIQLRKKKDGEFAMETGRGRFEKGGESHRHSDKRSYRSSHDYHRRDDYDRYQKRGDEGGRYHHRSSGYGREDRTRENFDHDISRDYRRHTDRYSKEESDGEEHRAKDKDREGRNKYRDKDKDTSLDRSRSGRRHSSSYGDDSKPGERDRYKKDGGGLDDTKNYCKSLDDDKNTHFNEEGTRRRSKDEQEGGGGRVRETETSNIKDLHQQKSDTIEKRKHHDRESDRHKGRFSRETDEQDFAPRNRRNFSRDEKFQDNQTRTSEDYEASPKKSRLFTEDKDKANGTERQFRSQSTDAADEKLPLRSELPQVTTDKVIPKPAESSNGAEASNDFNAAKVAAMKAAELVNRNLVGGGVMSTDQKKKLLWQSKKTTAAEETGHRWDVPLFSDRERQEKFNKLMGVKGEVKPEHKPENKDTSGLVQAEKQEQLQLDLEKQYTAGLRRRDGRTVGLGL